MTPRSDSRALRRPERPRAALRHDPFFLRALLPAPPRFLLPRGPAARALALALVLGGCAPALFSEPPERSASEGLVYVVTDPEDPRHTDVWRARLSDGAVQPLIQTPDRNEARPTWSARASALVFQAVPGAGLTAPGRLLLWREGGESPLPGERARTEIWPTWSPLDSRLVYAVGGLALPGGEEAIRTGVVVVDLDEGEQTILARGGRAERYVRPSFSPDGHRVVVQYRTTQPRSSRIALLEPQGEAKLLTGPEWLARDPSFTRDGRHILFSRRSLRPEPRDLVRMRLDGSDAHPIASTPESDDYGQRASPIRDEIAFLSDRNGKQDAYRASLAGGPPFNLTESLAFDVTGLRWSPDGEYVAMTAFPLERPKDEARQAFAPAIAEVLVVDRRGRLVFRTAGLTPEWMPPWD